MKYRITAAIILVGLLSVTHCIYSQGKLNTLPHEGKIHVTLDAITEVGAQPLSKPTVIIFLGYKLIEPLDVIKIVTINGKQQKDFVNNGYNIINVQTATYIRIEKMACGLKLSQNGDLTSKSEGIYLSDDRDLFKNNSSLQALPDTIVGSVKYKRYQVYATDPSTRKNIRAVAFVIDKKSELPVSISKSLENKYHCTISYVELFYPDLKGHLRMAFTYEAYKLTKEEKQIFQCYK